MTSGKSVWQKVSIAGSLNIISHDGPKQGDKKEEEKKRESGEVSDEVLLERVNAVHVIGNAVVMLHKGSSCSRVTPGPGQKWRRQE